MSRVVSEHEQYVKQEAILCIENFYTNTYYFKNNYVREFKFSDRLKNNLIGHSFWEIEGIKILSWQDLKK